MVVMQLMIPILLAVPLMLILVTLYTNGGGEMGREPEVRLERQFGRRLKLT